MNSIINFVICALAVCLAVPVGAVPPPLTEGIQSFNVTIPLNSTSNDTISALGYDPSNDWHGYATVEVWTGGGSRKPVNVGHLNGLDLHRQIYDTFNRACPPTATPWGGYCDGNKWLDFHTKYLFAPPADVRECTGWIKPGNAQWATDQLRIIMMNIVGEVYAAYTEQPIGTNCYEVPGQGKFCNVPQFVRVNLPDSSPAHMGWKNFWHAEIWGCPNEFSRYGNLKPCGTRSAVDAKLDKYAGELEAEFPPWKSNFKRDTRVIIDGWKTCTDEP